MLNFTKTDLKNAVRDHMSKSRTKKYYLNVNGIPMYREKLYTREQAVAEIRYRINQNLPLTGW